MTQPTKATRGAASARPSEGVATEAPRSTQSGDAADPPTDQQAASDTSTCADCGSGEVVYVTEDPAAEPKGYCKTHLPANITDKMVEEQGRT